MKNVILFVAEQAVTAVKQMKLASL